MRYFRIIILLALSLPLLSCLTNHSDETIQKSIISDKLQRISESFFRLNSEAIMNLYHPDFLHNGVAFSSQKFVWESRMIYYYMMDIEVISIEIVDDYALARLKVYYYDRQNKQGPFIEPEHNGDFSFFVYDKGDWWIFGNREL